MIIYRNELKNRILILLCLIAVLIVDYNLFGIKSVFILVPICLLVGIRFILNKTIIKYMCIINLIIVFMTIYPMFCEWFSVKEFFNSLINFNALILYGYVFLKAARKDTDFCITVVFYTIVSLCILTIIQFILYYTFGTRLVIQTNAIRWAELAENVIKLRAGAYRPHAIFTEPSHLCGVLTGLELYYMNNRKSNMLFIIVCIAEALTISLTGMISVVVLVTYVLIANKEISKKQRRGLLSVLCVFFLLALILILFTKNSGYRNNTAIYSLLIRLNHVLNSNDVSTSYRFGTGGKLCIEAIKTSPIVGVGLGQHTEFANFINLYAEGRSKLVLNMTWYEVAVFWGIIGIVVICFVLYRLIRHRSNKVAILLFLLYITLSHGTFLFVFLYGLMALLLSCEHSNSPIDEDINSTTIIQSGSHNQSVVG